MQTVDLLKISDGEVLALDFLPLMIERTKSSAAHANVLERLEVLEQDMTLMDFPPGSFDVTWSESAIYNLGFEDGLRKVKSFVRPGGHVVVSEAVWPKPDPPPPVIEFWTHYPEIDTVENKLAVIDRVGYKLQDCFVLPKNAWTVDYYEPMERLLVEKSKDWEGIPQGLSVIEEARQEIELYRKYSDYYGYAFFVMRRPEGQP